MDVRKERVDCKHRRGCRRERKTAVERLDVSAGRYLYLVKAYATISAVLASENEKDMQSEGGQ